MTYTSWNKEKMEDELHEQLRTVLRLINLFKPKNEEEFMAVATPNMTLWLFKEFTGAVTFERLRLRKKIATLKASPELYRINRAMCEAADAKVEEVLALLEDKTV